MTSPVPPPPPPPRPPSPPEQPGWGQGYGEPQQGYGQQGYGQQPGWQYPPAPPGAGGPPGAPPYGYGPPPGWGYIAPNHATRLGFRSAGFGERLGALILDSLILAAISIPFWALGIWWVASNWEEEPGICVDDDGFRYACDVATDATAGRLVLTLVGGGLLMLVASIFYWGKFEGQRGQTPGKKALGLRVMRQETGQPIGFGRAVGRMFARYLSSQVVCLGYLWMLWDDNKQTWHDKIVSSIVVKE